MNARRRSASVQRPWGSAGVVGIQQRCSYMLWRRRSTGLIFRRTNPFDVVIVLTSLSNRMDSYRELDFRWKE
ncbi:unnamed protein product [Ceratitis capitata]|uniref:(Mediterranean fruit fly) hypothetical protein n=1 Tax=Ceratitis capitata TaxID=7213 RepID=A0A811U137_CERCA|nr:unnamed protein product [Ceratitis capitata]